MAAGINLYSYVFNNPVHWIDSMGNEVIFEHRVPIWPGEKDPNMDDVKVRLGGGGGLGPGGGSAEVIFDKCCKNNKMIERTILKVCVYGGIVANIKTPSLPVMPGVDPGNEGNCGKDWWVIEKGNLWGLGGYIIGVDSKNGLQWAPWDIGFYWKYKERCEYSVIGYRDVKGCCK